MQKNEITIYTGCATAAAAERLNTISKDRILGTDEREQRRKQSKKRRITIRLTSSRSSRKQQQTRTDPPAKSANNNKILTQCSKTHIPLHQPALNACRGTHTSRKHSSSFVSRFHGCSVSVASQQTEHTTQSIRRFSSPFLSHSQSFRWAHCGTNDSVDFDHQN